MLWASLARAAGTFYVDGSNPACSDAGPGSAAVPYCSISAAVSAQGGPGTIINVKPATYREQVSVLASGSSGSPFVIRASGSPAVIDGADDFSSTPQWDHFSGDVWVAAAVTWSPVQVFMGGARLTPSTAPGSLAPGAFVYVSGSGLYVNAGGGNPGTRALFVGRRSHAFYLSGQSWVKIDGFTVTRTEDKGIELVASSNSDTVSHNLVSFAGSAGIAVESGSNEMIASNTVSDNNHHGIQFRLGVTGSTIQDNLSVRNVHSGLPWANGIYLAQSPGNLIQRNRVHDNQDTGIEIQSGSNDNVLLQNLSWNNGDHGFEHLFATGNTEIGDVSWGNLRDGFSVEGSATGTHIFDCISVNNGTTANEYDLYVDSSSTAGFASNFNIYWNSGGAPPIKYDKVVYATLGAYVAATGLDLKSTSADPRFVDPGNGDFHLKAGSPAIDAASSSISGWPSTDVDGKGRVDDPPTPNTGEGPVPYADRGAFEFGVILLGVEGGKPSILISLSSGVPNPGRRSVAFSLDLDHPASGSWSIFDVQGRALLTEDRLFPRGRSELRWNTMDLSGAPSPPGVYLVRVSVGGEVLTRRIVLMR